LMALVIRGILIWRYCRKLRHIERPLLAVSSLSYL
jgi:hypothetical protein